VTRCRVLIIDDEELVVRSFSRVLSREHHVTAVFSAADALQRAVEGETWDVILCDLQMPGMDGTRFCEYLERFRPDLLQRLAFVTGGAITSRVQAFLERTKCPVVFKPIEPDQLRAIVGRVAPHCAKG
jgi:CheY-like chemotaxis protein